jgi:hypothetical protein
VKRDEIVVLLKPAVFTTTTYPFPDDEGPERGIHRSRVVSDGGQESPRYTLGSPRTGRISGLYSGPSDGDRSCGVRPVPRSTDRAVTKMEENRRPRLRFRLRTILLVVAILALLLVVVIQQVQIGRLREAQAKERDRLTTIIREMRYSLERHR